MADALGRGRGERGGGLLWLVPTVLINFIWAPINAWALMLSDCSAAAAGAGAANLAKIKPGPVAAPED